MRFKILVTGANGLLGRQMCEKLVQAGHEVFGLIHAAIFEPLEGVEYIQLDLSTYWNYGKLPAAVDVVMHFAQSANYKDFPSNALDVFRVNLESTARLLDYAHRSGVQKFIYASSGGVYGNGMNAFHENAPIVTPGKLGYYLGSKASSEIMVHSYADVFQVIIIRPFFMYGARQKPGMLIPRLMNSIEKELPISLQGETGIRINPVHVEDAARAVLSSLQLEESATFNVAGPEIISIRDICDLMGHFVSKQAKYTAVPGEPQDLVADISSMQNLLHRPTILLKDKLNEVFVCLKN